MTNSFTCVCVCVCVCCGVQASSIAQQAIASVRTVMAYNAQDNAQRAYAAALEKPVKVRHMCAVLSSECV